MKILNLSDHGTMYTSNVYLVTGTWNTLDDINTLIDVGRDPGILERLEAASTGVGKKRVEQVILTHSHYDHASMLPLIRQTYNPIVRAYSRSLAGVDVFLNGGEHVHCGDRDFEIIHVTAHSSDSICCFCEQDGILFAGDIPIIIRSGEGTFDQNFIDTLEYLSRRKINAIYFGHGAPLLSGCDDMLAISLANVRGETDK